ncbi:hypothetical protein [Alkalicoccobacillus gibsonii]|uniref:hypothetical protein n=1 Tax=Alkalicoccobacillus gibsonii TaxID=79881 RepID=UPI001934A98F|nr:hypothetical protein [Alkalicoccobacillus gibsonii]MBM0064916.1 hypothetical protein [Alkalicoccobacillus gibsonii]
MLITNFFSYEAAHVFIYESLTISKVKNTDEMYSQLTDREQVFLNQTLVRLMFNNIIELKDTDPKKPCISTKGRIIYSFNEVELFRLYKKATNQ